MKTRAKWLIASALVLAPSLANAQAMDLTDQSLPGAASGFKNGNFPAMTSPGPVVGHFIQNAWNDAPAGAGVKEQYWSASDTVRVRLRAGMISTIVIPNGDVIADYSLGDQTNFNVRPVDSQRNKLWVWSVNPGYDTNLNIIGKSGAVYAFYLRGETANSKNISQQVVRLTGSTPNFGGVDKAEKATAQLAVGADAQQAIYQLGDNMPDVPPDYLQKGCIFDPTKIRTDRIMNGDKQIAPVRVFRDDCFTYLDWGKNPDARSWPGVWKLVDGVDEPVNFDPSKDGRFMVVYSIKPLTLKDGKKVVCINPTDGA